MTVHIVARHVRLTKTLKDYIQGRVDKLQHYFDHIIWAQVSISAEKNVRKAEIVIHAARQTFKSSASGDDLVGVIDGAADKMDTQVKKYKDRMKDHRDRESIVFAVPEMAALQADVKFSVVKQVPVQPMKPEEAVFEMERLGFNFWLFLDSETSQINLVFKRQDNSYGVMQPVKRKVNAA
ncbi:MAG: ribosome-associated translation inhibitor RaiA [Elusimicrobiaceae bacterium]